MPAYKIDPNIEAYRSSCLADDLSVDLYFSSKDKGLRSRSRRHQAALEENEVEALLLRHGRIVTQLGDFETAQPIR